MALLVFGLFAVFFVTFKIYTDRFYNPYKLILYMGKKGVGKSTVLQKLAWAHYKKKWHIYCNYGDSTFQKATQIDCSRLWEAEIKPHSVVLIDEVNLLWDNRDFKKFPQELNRWFRAQRHNKIKVIMFSQTADVDKKIRDLTDRIYLVRRYFQVLIMCYPFEKDIDPPNPKRMQNGNDFVDTYRKKNVGPIGIMYCWLPKWVKMHDSFKEIAITDEDRERIMRDIKSKKDFEWKEDKKDGRSSNKRSNGASPRSDRRGNSVYKTTRAGRKVSEKNK